MGTGIIVCLCVAGESFLVYALFRLLGESVRHSPAPEGAARRSGRAQAENRVTKRSGTLQDSESFREPAGLADVRFHFQAFVR